MEEKTKKRLIIAAWIVGIIIVLFIAYKAFQYFKKQRQNSLLDNNTVTANVNGQPATVNIGTKVTEIHDALHGSWYSEDEQKAINAVLSTPQPLIPNLSQTYFAVTGINLKQDLQEYLSASEWMQIAYLFN